MEHNKNLKRKLREELPLPKSLGWEQMQEGIFEQMEQPERKRRGFFIFLPWKKILGAALLVLNFSVMAYLIYLIQEKEQLGTFPIPIEHQSQSSSITQEKEVFLLEESTIIASEKKQTATTTLLQQKSPVPNLIEQKNLSTIEENNLSTNHNYKHNYKHNYTLSESHSKKSSDKKTTIINNLESTKGAEKETPILKGATTTRTLSPPFPVNAFSCLKSSTNLLNPTVQESTIADFKLEKPAFAPYYALEISGGVNDWQSNYKVSSTEQNTRSESETELWGFQIAAHAKYHFKPNLYFSSGLAFQQLNHRFNYENTSKDQVEARDALVGIAINSISGDSTFFRQDVMIDVEEKRKVQHYNRHQILTVPLRLGYEWRHNRIALSGSLGSVFSIQSFSKGKTLVGSEIRTYDQNDSIYKKRFGMGLSANLQLSYALTPDLYLGGNVVYNNWLSNWSTEQTAESRPNISRFSVVLGKKF